MNIGDYTEHKSSSWRLEWVGWKKVPKQISSLVFSFLAVWTDILERIFRTF